MHSGYDMELVLPSLNEGDVFLLSSAPLAGMGSLVLPLEVFLPALDRNFFAAGTVLREKKQEHVAFQVTGRHFLPAASGHSMVETIFVRSLCKMPAGVYTVTARAQGYSLAVITLSDKGAAGLRVDESGPLVAHMVQEALPLRQQQLFILPDTPAQLRALVAGLTLHQRVDLVITTGGTGLTSRDTTPEALLPLFERHLHGFTQAMMAASLSKTPHAVLSRAVAGIIGNSIVFTLPGSKKAVKENLEVLLPALGHALAKLHDNPDDCGT